MAVARQKARFDAGECGATATPSSCVPPPVPAWAVGARVAVPEGEATLGHDPTPGTFRWDCEGPRQAPTAVRAFVASAAPVTNADLAAFIAVGGYGEAKWWHGAGVPGGACDGGARARGAPAAWSRTGPGGAWHISYPHATHALADVASCPAWASGAEAAAVAAAAGGRLPAEAEVVRLAAVGGWARQRGLGGLGWGGLGREGWMRLGLEARLEEKSRGQHAPASPTQTPPSSSSSAACLGRLARPQVDAATGWEWTATPLAAWPGSARDPLYPGFSADFHGGGHAVVVGGSPATPALLLGRPGVRNWFQGGYPHAFCQFRVVWDG